jgi:hypothetical protein
LKGRRVLLEQQHGLAAIWVFWAAVNCSIVPGMPIPALTLWTYYWRAPVLASCGGAAV